MAAAFSWKRTLLKAFAPLAAVLAYYVWRKGTAFTHSGRFWVLLAVVFVPDVAAELASGHLEQRGRHRAAATVGVAGRVWLVALILWLAMHDGLP
jgi:uncharacterized membrane protein YozB (DUF420 family)